MRFRGVSCVLATAVALLPLAGSAKEDPTRPDLAFARPNPDFQGRLEVSLADALSLGLENNLGIEILRHTPLISHEDHRAAWGTYDPVWNAEIGYSDVENPNANAIIGQPVNAATVFDGIGGISGLVPWLGASYDVSLTGSDVRTDTVVQALSPELRSEVFFGLRLPMLRGLIWNEPWTLVKTTERFEASAWEGFRRDVMDTVQAIEDGYWFLIANDELVRVAEKSLETAEALLKQVKTQYEVGVVSKVEISQADAGVAEREFDLITAENVYRNGMDEFINLILGPNLTADSRIEVIPTDRPEEYIAYEIDVEEASQIAFRNRPDLAIARIEVDRLGINLKFAKNQRLPRFDAILGYGNRGIAGSPNPDFSFGAPVPDLGGFDKTFEQPGDFFTGDAATQLSARAVVEIPFPNTVGRANVSKAQLQLRRGEVRKRRTQQDIIVEIRIAARTLKAAQEGIDAAERRKIATAEQLRAEKIRLEYGESTPFDVLLKERDLVEAEQLHIEAFKIYRLSVTFLDRSQGTILRNRNIQIDDVARLR